MFFAKANERKSVAQKSYRTLVALLLVFSLTFSGCLTLSPSVMTDTSTSSVFESLSTDEPWSGQHVRVNATLRSTPDAGNVTTISIIGESGQPYSTVSLDSGQTTVFLWVPTNQNSTLVASNSVNSTTLDTVNVTPGGNRVF